MLLGYPIRFHASMRLFVNHQIYCVYLVHRLVATAVLPVLFQSNVLAWPLPFAPGLRCALVSDGSHFYFHISVCNCSFAISDTYLLNGVDSFRCLLSRRCLRCVLWHCWFPSLPQGVLSFIWKAYNLFFSAMFFECSG